MNHPLENEVKRKTTSWDWKDLVDEGREVGRYQQSLGIKGILRSLAALIIGIFIVKSNMSFEPSLIAYISILMGIMDIYFYIYHKFNKILFFKTNIIFRKANFKYRIVDLKDLKQTKIVPGFFVSRKIKGYTKERKKFLNLPYPSGSYTSERNNFQDFLKELPTNFNETKSEKMFQILKENKRLTELRKNAKKNEKDINKKTTSWHWKDLVEEGAEVFEYPFKHKASKNIFLTCFALFFWILGFVAILVIFYKQSFQVESVFLLGLGILSIHSYIYYRINKILFFKTFIILRKANFKYRIVDLKGLEDLERLMPVRTYSPLRGCGPRHIRVKVYTKGGKSVAIPSCSLGIDPKEIEAFEKFIEEVSNR